MPIYPPSQSLVPLLLTQATSRRRHHRHRRHSLTHDDDHHHHHRPHVNTNLSPPSSPRPPQSTDQVVWSFGGDSEIEDEVEDDAEDNVDDDDEHHRASVDDQGVLESDNESEDGSGLDSESDESESDSSSLSLTYLTDGEDENNGESSLAPVDPSSLDPADPLASTTTPTESLDDLRQASSQRLAQAWKDIFERYEGRDENEADDEIDLMTGEIIVDQGFLRDQEKTLFGTMTRLGLELKGPQEVERERLRRASRIARRRSKDRQQNQNGSGGSQQRTHGHRDHSNEAHHLDNGPSRQMYGGDDFDNLLFVPKDSNEATPAVASRRLSMDRSESPEKVADSETDFPQSSASDWDGEADENWDKYEEEQAEAEAQALAGAEEEPPGSPARVSRRPTASDTLPFQRESSLSSSHSGSLEERMALISRRRSRMMPRTVALADSLFSKRPPSSLARSSSPSPPLPSVSASSSGWTSAYEPVPATSGLIRPSTANATTALTSLLLARSVKRKHNHFEDEEMRHYDQEDEEGEEEDEEEDVEEKDQFGFTPSPSPPRSPAPDSPPPSSRHLEYFTTPTKKQRQEGQFSSFGMFGASSPSTTTSTMATTATLATPAISATTMRGLLTPRTALAKTIDLLSLHSPPPSSNRASLPPLPSLPPTPSLSLFPLSNSSSATSATPPETTLFAQEVMPLTPAPPALPTCGGPGFCTKDFCFKCM